METYTFKINYRYENDSQTLAGIDLDSPGSSSISIGVTNQAFQELLRRIMDVSQHLPLLPRKWKLLRIILGVLEADVD